MANHQPYSDPLRLLAALDLRNATENIHRRQRFYLTSC